MTSIPGQVHVVSGGKERSAQLMRQNPRPAPPTRRIAPQIPKASGRRRGRRQRGRHHARVQCVSDAGRDGRGPVGGGRETQREHPLPQPDVRARDFLSGRTAAPRCGLTPPWRLPNAHNEAKSLCAHVSAVQGEKIWRAIFRGRYVDSKKMLSLREASVHVQAGTLFVDVKDGWEACFRARDIWHRLIIGFASPHLNGTCLRYGKSRRTSSAQRNTSDTRRLHRRRSRT